MSGFSYYVQLTSKKKIFTTVYCLTKSINWYSNPPIVHHPNKLLKKQTQRNKRPMPRTVKGGRQSCVIIFSLHISFTTCYSMLLLGIFLQSISTVVASTLSFISAIVPARFLLRCTVFWVSDFCSSKPFLYTYTYLLQGFFF